MKQKRLLTSIAALFLTAVLALSVLGGCAQAGSRNDKTGLGSETITVQTGEAQTQQTVDGKETVTEQNAGKNQPSGDKEPAADQTADKDQFTADNQETPKSRITEDGEYYSKEDVAEYIYLYEHLPDNYITKNEAKDLGWVSNKGNLWDVAPGKVIGGDTFGNREGLLPEKKSRKYYECDVNYEGGFRGSDRIIYSNDGLVYFTEDHYNTFELLYGEED